MLNYLKNNLRMVFVYFLFDNDEKLLFLKNIPISTLECKVHTLFMAKKAEKPYPLGPHRPV